MKFDKRFIKQLLIVIIATLCVGICILDFLYAALGSDSLTVFEEGLSKALHTSIGNGAIIYNVSSLVLDLIFFRKNIGWTTIVNALGVGVSVNIAEPLLLPFLTLSSSLPFRILLFVLGMIFCCVGCALLIYGKAGMSTLDALCTGIGELIKVPYRYVRIAADALLLISGYLMGGVVGVGSVFAMLLTGPLISSLADLFRKYLPEL